MDRHLDTPSSHPVSPSSSDPVSQPRSVTMAIRAAWALVGLIGLTVVLMAVFYDQVVGSWAARHEGARQAFAQGGREGLARANFAPPAFLPVTATMFVVAAMLVWVLSAFLREGHRWGQVGLSALVLVAVFASIALGFVLSPPAVFVMVAVLSLLVEGLALVCLWHRDTLAYLAGPWLDGPADESGGESDDGSGGTVPPTAGGADRQDASRDPAQPPV